MQTWVLSVVEYNVIAIFNKNLGVHAKSEVKIIAFLPIEIFKGAFASIKPDRVFEIVGKHLHA